MSSSTHTNRLARETSPYLLQHAHNPVDWYPWGEEALQLAEKLDRPILLSIGYAACHWCHVMERECFENPNIAAQMNRDFVCIKVDREERPDLDDVYMAATIALTGAGGWPMTVFLTPEQTPFFAGTYFPPDDRGGRLGFSSLLERIAELWQDDRDQLFRQGAELLDHIQRQARLEPARSISASAIPRAAASLAQSFDAEWGGFGSAPKFPPSQAMHLLLRKYHGDGDVHALEMVTRTLDAMKDGGIYDQLRGGFARYSTDREWLAPHFEKMLYDNAQLARVYLEAFQVTGSLEYKRVVVETLDYICAEMQGAEGGYYSATDADSEGVEGKYFTFTTKQLRQILEPEETRVVAAYYGLTEAGNWEGSNILHVRQSLDQVAKTLNSDRETCATELQRARAKLLAARKLRVAPLLDDKVLVSWNALMLGTMAEAGRVLGEPRYLQSATRAADFIWHKMRDAEGVLFRTRRGDHAHVRAFLEDYAALSDAFIDLYEAHGDDTWLLRARELATTLLADFRDAHSGAFFQTSEHHDPLIVRTRDGNDGALPNANAVAARALWRLAQHCDEPALAAHASAALRAYAHRVEQLPRAHLTTLNVLDGMLEPALEVVLSGAAEAREPLARELAAHFLPRRHLAYAASGNTVPASTFALGKGNGGKATLYLCEDRVCDRPITSPSDIGNALSQHSQRARTKRVQQLRPARIEGRATAAGTTQYFEKLRIDPSAVHSLGALDLQVGRIGFGGHRLHEDIAEQQEALLLALRSGCNLCDTAPIYTAGASERAVGNAVSELIRTAELSREQVVLVSKLGLHPAVADAASIPGAVTLGDDLCASLDPTWLAQQLDATLERLNVATLDVCLLHNPELLLPALGADELWLRLGRALQWLEDQVTQGKVAAYGISCNELLAKAPPPGAPPALTLADLEKTLREQNAGHFAVLQLPLNPLESRPWDAGVIARAQALGWAVLTQRPLSAMLQGELWRLADAPEDPDAPSLDEALDALQHVEAEFRTRLGAVLDAAAPQGADNSEHAAPRSSELLAWGTRLPRTPLRSRALWNEYERSVLAPELGRALGGLDRAFAGKQLGQVWRDFRKRYVQQIEHLLLAARAHSAHHGNLATAPITARLSRVPSMPQRATLSQRVVGLLSSLPGVSSVLVGMRTTSQVQDALATLNWSALDEAASGFLDEAALQKLTHAQPR